MQIQSLRIKSYRSWHVNDSASDVAIARLQKLERYAELKSQGCDEVVRLKAIGCSRSTYYRWLSGYKRYGLRGLDDFHLTTQEWSDHMIHWTWQRRLSIIKT